MASNAPRKFLFIPPQSDTTRQWARALAQEVRELRVVVAESDVEALREISDADAAFGTLTPELVRAARSLKWLQAPAIAPPAGYYFPELVEHPVTVTNFRGQVQAMASMVDKLDFTADAADVKLSASASVEKLQNLMKLAGGGL